MTTIALITSLFLLVYILDLAPQHETLDGSLVQRPTREEYPHDEVGVGVAVEVLVEPEQDEGHQAVREPEEGEHRSDGLKGGWDFNDRGSLLPLGCLTHYTAREEGCTLKQEYQGRLH